MNEVTLPIVRLGILHETPVEGRKLAVFLFQEFRREFFAFERVDKHGKSLMKFLGGWSLLVVCVPSRVLIQSKHTFRSRYPIASTYFPFLVGQGAHPDLGKHWDRCGSPTRRDGHHGSNYHKEPWRCLFQSTDCPCRWACDARLS